MNATIVAEAVETAGQLQTLIHLGIEYGQGFHLGAPDAWRNRDIGDCGEPRACQRDPIAPSLSVAKNVTTPPHSWTRLGGNHMPKSDRTRRT